MRLLPGEQLVTAIAGHAERPTTILLASQTGRLHWLELSHDPILQTGRSRRNRLGS
jgi:hypothetical protein